MMDPLTTKRRELLKLNEKFPHGSPVKFQGSPNDEIFLAVVTSTWMMDSGGTPRVLVELQGSQGVTIAHQGQLFPVDMVNTFDLGGAGNSGVKITLTMPHDPTTAQIEAAYNQIVPFLRQLYFIKEGKAHEESKLGKD